MTLLDGGMGQELVRRSARPPSSMWSARVLLDEPALVATLHREYIEAGADVITLASYSATPERLTRDADVALFEPLQAAACDVARRARDAADRTGVRIAGTLPPLFASYHANIDAGEAETLATYRRIVSCQRDACDLVLCETMASVNQARLAATAALESTLPVWVALTVDDACSGALRSGEPLERAVQMLEALGVDAILLNCSTPEAIDAAWPALTSATVATGVYANAFHSIDALAPGGTVDALERRDDLGPEAYAAFAERWIDAGATIIGGCCETTPAHIRELDMRRAARGRPG